MKRPDGVMDRIDVIRFMREQVDAAGGVKSFARLKGLSPSYVSEALNGTDNFGPKIMAAFGFGQVQWFVKTRSKE